MFRFYDLVLGVVDLGFGPSGSGVQYLGFMQGFVLWPQ